MKDYKKLSTYLEAQQLRPNKYDTREGFGALAVCVVGIIGMAIGAVLIPMAKLYATQTVVIKPVACNVCHYNAPIKNLKQYKARHQIKPPNLAELSH